MPAVSKLNITVIAAERGTDVSLRSGSSVAAALRSLGHNVSELILRLRVEVVARNGCCISGIARDVWRRNGASGVGIVGCALHRL